MDPDKTIKSHITEILPNTKRTQERRQKQLEEEMKKKKEAEFALKAEEEQKKQIKQLLMEKAAQQKAEEDRRKEEESRKQEELQQINTLKGEFGYMINDLKSGQSKLDYTISGLDLRPAQIRILVKVTETNNTLKGLSMARKKIQDDEGVELIRSLEKNMVLERLEMEGNHLGSKSASALAVLLETNRSLRVVDMENNNLTNQNKDLQQDNSGIVALCKSLKKNDALLCLNLCNCKLDKICGQALVEAMEENETLIALDVEENPGMDLMDVRKIQEYLKRNKKAYDDERYREFKERKRLGKEEQISTIQIINHEAKELALDGIDTRIKARKLELENQWKEELERETRAKEKIVHNLQKQAKLLNKKKGKGGAAKKK